MKKKVPAKLTLICKRRIDVKTASIAKVSRVEIKIGSEAQ